MDSRHLILVGPMGSGKTTVGRDLAARFGRPHRDTDAAVVHGAGCSIAEIFAKWGEDDFRRRESKVLTDVLAGPPCVVSTGGGIVVSASNREAMRAAGSNGRQPLVVWLDAGVEALVKRVRSGRGRPLLEGDVEGNLAVKVAEREAFYLEVADVRVDTTGRGRPATVELVADLIEREGGL